MFGSDPRGRRTWRRPGTRESRQSARVLVREMRSRGVFASLLIAGVFWIAITSLFLLRKDVVPYRPNQYVPHDIVARVDFQFFDEARHDDQVKAARESSQRVYRAVPGDIWGKARDYLLSLPDLVRDRTPEELDPPLRNILDSGAITQLEQDSSGPARDQYQADVKQFINYARNHLTSPGQPLVILSQADRDEENRLPGQPRTALLLPPTADPDNPHPVGTETAASIDLSDVYGPQLPDSIRARLENYAKGFGLGLGSKIAQITAAELTQSPDYLLDEQATANQKNDAEKNVDPRDAYQAFGRSEVIVSGGNTLSVRDWQILNAENKAYHESLMGNVLKMWQYRLGLALLAGIVTLILCGYVARYQPRCVRNHARGIAMASLLISMLLLSQLAGIGNSSLYIFGIAPTIVAAMILTIAYDQRFALGMATIHTIIVTAALNQGLDFFMILWVGVLTACYLLDDIRTRSRLIEIGGASALAMIIVATAVGAVEMEPIQFIGSNCLYVGASGLAAGFVVLGILPFIEKAFRITTSMTLLELADASQPLLRRLALEAPGTYNHSLQVATLAEAAAESIHANSLLCRVGSYYHDIGKINKPDYFVENQMGGENRHLNLSPTLSLRIILSHVKEGVEMAKDYNLPTSILPIIQQHHGTTLVEYFYHQAVQQGDQQAEPGPKLSDTEFRYPGPKPKSKEAAIVMLCDAVESACRTLAEPTASRLEAKVHELARLRLEDGQFAECDLTMRDLEQIERALCKTLLGIYHGRIAYPSSETTASSAPIAPAARTA